MTISFPPENTQVKLCNFFTSMVVNSGLWRVERPSLRNILPISYTFSNPPTCQLPINAYCNMTKWQWCVDKGYKQKQWTRYWAGRENGIIQLPHCEYVLVILGILLFKRKDKSQNSNTRNSSIEWRQHFQWLYQ